MTGLQLAMGTQVTTALISGGIALIVALLGIAGAITAQLLASRRAAENSLTLLRQQYAEQDKQMRQQYDRQELERHEETRREDAYRFAIERKTAYGRFLRLVGELQDAQVTVHRAEEGARGFLDSPFARSLASKDYNPWAPAEAARAKERELSAALRTVHQEIRLIASPDVQAASDHMLSWVRIQRDLGVEDKADHYDGYSPARDRFLAAARKELGIVMESES